MGEFTYVGDRMSAGGGCETAMAVRRGCGWIMIGVCSELLYGRRFPLKLKGTF